MKSEFEDLPPIDDELVKKESGNYNKSIAKKGISKSPEHVAKIAAALKGRKLTDVDRATKSAAQKGIKKTAEQLKNRIGRVVSEESRERMRQAALNRKTAKQAKV